MNIEYVKPEGKPALILLTPSQREAYHKVESDSPDHGLAQAILAGDDLRRSLGEVKTATFDIREPNADDKIKVGILVSRKVRKDEFWQDATPDELWPLRVLASYDVLHPQMKEGPEEGPTQEMKEALAEECAYRIFVEPQIGEERADFLN